MVNFLKRVRDARIEKHDHLTTHHYYLWKHFEQMVSRDSMDNNEFDMNHFSYFGRTSKDVLRLICSLTVAQVKAAFFFAVDIDALVEVSNIEWLEMPHLILLMSLQKEDRNLETLKSISLMSDLTVKISLFLKVRSKLEVYAIRDLHVTYHHYDAFCSLDLTDQTPKVLLMTIHLSEEHVRAFMALPREEADLYALEAVADVSDDLIKAFLELDGERTLKTIELLRRLDQEKIELLRKIYLSDDIEGGIGIVDKLNTAQVEIANSLEVDNLNSDILEKISKMTARHIRAYLSLVDRDKDIFSLELLFELNPRQMSLFLVLNEGHHTYYNLMRISSFSNKQISVIVDFDDITTTVVKNVFNLSETQIDIFLSLSSDSQTLEAMRLIRQIFLQKQHLYKLGFTSADLPMLRDIASMSYNSMLLFARVPATEQNSETSAIILGLSEEQLDCCLSSTVFHSNIDYLRIVNSLSVFHIRLFNAVNKISENAVRDLTLIRQLSQNQAEALNILGVRNIGRVNTMLKYNCKGLPSQKIVSLWRDKSLTMIKENSVDRQVSNFGIAKNVVHQMMITTIIRRDLVPILIDFRII